MDTLRIGSFNCENLFARYRFRQNFDPIGSDGFTINDIAFEIFDSAEKRITAKAIKAANADILALQEVENLLVLDRFHSAMLQGRMYPHRLLIDGNDPRNIDIAVVSRYPIIAARTYRHERDKEGRADLFSRDCLEVDFDVDGKMFTLFVNHFKSMMEGRAKTRDRRLAQAERVAAIVSARFGDAYDGNYAVVGDLNDYPQTADGAKTALTALLKHPGLVNIVDYLPEDQRWTHWFKGGKRGERARQLDYLLLGRGLDKRAKKPKPEIMRMGLPWRAEEDYSGERFEEVGHDEPKASDHCPVTVEIPKSALI